MSLEKIQQGTNAQRVALARTTASNDPNQLKHDRNDLLIKGADLAGAGRTLGMSEEEVLAAVSRQFRRQARGDDKTTKNDILRKMVQAANTTTSSVGSAELDGVGYLASDDEAFAFGDDVGQRAEYTGSGDRITGADNSQTYRADDRGFTQDEETGLVRRENFEEGKGQYVGQRKEYDMQDGKMITRYTGEPEYDTDLRFAPQSATSDALAGLQAKIQQEGYDRNPGSRDAESALQDQLSNRRALDRSGARDAVMQDNRRFNPEMREYNDNRAAAEASAIGRNFQAGMPGAEADQALAAIGEIAKLRSVKDPRDAKVRNTAQDAILGQIAVRGGGADQYYVDPISGNPVAIQGPELPSSDRVPNDTSSSNALNAPQTAKSWVNQTMADNKEGARYDNVDITGTTNELSANLRALGAKLGIAGFERIDSNLRNISELQKVAEVVARQKPIATGKDLMKTVRDEETGKTRSVAAGTDIVDGLMSEMRMTGPQRRDIATALFQLDAARRSSVNENPTGTYLSRSDRDGVRFVDQGPSTAYDGAQGISASTRQALNQNVDTQQRGKQIIFNAPEAINPREDAAPRATIGSAKVGVRDAMGNTKRVDAGALMRQLPSKDAAMPYIGAIRGEEAPQRYNRTGERDPARIAEAIGVPAIQRARRDGKPVDKEAVGQNIKNAIQVQQRADADLTRRAEQMSAIIEGLPPTARRSPVSRR